MSKEIEIYKHEITEYIPFSTLVAEIKKKFTNVVYDLSDAENMKQAKNDIKEINKAVKSLDNVHDDIKKPFKIKVDLIDSERKIVKDEALLIKEKITKQIKAHEQIEVDRSNAILRRINEMNDHKIFDESTTTSMVLSSISTIKKIKVDETFQEHQGFAAISKADTLELLEGKLALLEKQDAQAKADEEARLHAQKEREEQIAKEAAAEAERKSETEKQARMQSEKQAAIDKENAEKAAIVAKEKAKQEAKDADAKAKKQEESLRLEIQRQADFNRVNSIKIAKEAEAKRVADIEIAEVLAVENVRKKIAKAKQLANILAEEETAKIEKAKSNQKHRAKIHKEAKDSFTQYSFDDAIATKLVNLIKEGKIKNVKIEY